MADSRFQEGDSRPSPEGSSPSQPAHLDCNAINGRLDDLRKFFAERNSYGTVASAVRKFIEDHTCRTPGPNSLFFPTWEQDWKCGVCQADPDSNALFSDAPFQNMLLLQAFPPLPPGADEILDTRRKGALSKVCDELIRYLLNSEIPCDKEENSDRLVKALRKYLALRGYDVSPPADGAEGSEAESAIPKRRGRRKADYATLQCEAQLAADWKQAKESDVYKPDFARQKGMTAAKLDTLLDRVAKRRKRSDK